MAKTSKPEAASASEPPYIKRAHLRNVPPLRDVKVDFEPGLNIIIGKNGSGKTNFMKLLSELADLFKEKHNGIDSELVLAGEKEIKISFKLQKQDIINHKRQFETRDFHNTVLDALVDDGIVKVENKLLFAAFRTVAYGLLYPAFEA